MNTDTIAIAGVVIALVSVTLGFLFIWPPLALIVGGALAGAIITGAAVAVAMQDARGPEDE